MYYAFFFFFLFECMSYVFLRCTISYLIIRFSGFLPFHNYLLMAFLIVEFFFFSYLIIENPFKTGLFFICGIFFELVYSWSLHEIYHLKCDFVFSFYQYIALYVIIMCINV